MTLGSLFAGIGGFELAAQWAGITPVWSNEIDPFCCKVLRKNFNHKIIEDDIRKIGKENLPSVDIISGGFPCQPFSHAGKRKGKADDRYLWPEMLRVIRELKPSYVVGENVSGLVNMEGGRTLDNILASLEDEGYTVESFIIPAASVGAWHRRNRVWIIAYSNSSTNRREIGRSIPEKKEEKGRIEKEDRPSRDIIRASGVSEIFSHASDSESIGVQRHGANRESVTQTHEKQGLFVCSSQRQGKSYWKTEPNVGRVANGIPNRMDRLKGLGNAIVPQVAYEIFKVINQFHAHTP